MTSSVECNPLSVRRTGQSAEIGKSGGHADDDAAPSREVSLLSRLGLFHEQVDVLAPQLPGLGLGQTERLLGLLRARGLP